MTSAQELEEYVLDLNSRVHASAHADTEGESLENAFTALMMSKLEDFEVLQDAIPFYYNRPAKGIKATGIAISEDERSCDVVITEFKDARKVTTLGQKQVEAVAKRAVKFVEGAFAGMHDTIDISFDANEWSRRLYELRPKLESIRLIIVTDARVERASIDDTTVDGKPLTTSIWDLERFHKVDTSAKGREPIEIDLQGTPLEAVKDDSSPTCTTYVLVVPGAVLADVYSRWGLRLLERNVRAYLQLFGPVNKGIRATLQAEPDRFLTYNNGLSAVAEQVETTREKGRLLITKVHDLQIVNGGQTTASLHRAKYVDGLDLENAKVQMKLTVIKDSASSEEVIPKISQYSNTQNSVQMADFASNDNYHLELEKLSRKITSPVQVEGQVSKWFYERIRQQYNVERSKRTGKDRRAFDAEYPKVQLFDKTDLAKAMNSWSQFPYLAAMGKQKNFGHFTQLTRKENPVVDDIYYKRTVAKVLLWKRALRMVRTSGMAGHWENTTAYSIAWMVHRMGGDLNLSRVWQEQKLRPSLETQFMEVATAVHKFLSTARPGVPYLGEWHKKQDCWDACKVLKIDLDAQFKTDYSQQEGFDEAGFIDGTAAAASVKEHQPAVWTALSKWGAQTRKLSSAHTLASMRVALALQKGEEPRPADAAKASQALALGREAGFDVKSPRGR